MILSLATLRTNWGSFSDSGTIRGITRPVAGALSMFVYVSMRKHPRDFGGRFGKSCRTGAVKLLITRRDVLASRLSSSGVPFAGLQPVPGGHNWAAIQPPLKG